MVTNDKILGIAGLNTLDILNNRYEPVKIYSTEVEPLLNVHKHNQSPAKMLRLPTANCRLLSAFVLLLVITTLPSYAQDLSNIGKAKPLTIDGGISLNQIYSHSDVASNLRKPYSYTLAANLNFALYGWSIPVSAVYSNQNWSYQQPFNQFSLHPAYKWIHTHIGYSSMSFSSYTLSGHQFLGGGVELTPPGNWKISAMAGRMQKRVLPDSAGTITPMYYRFGSGLRTEYTFKAGNLGLSVFYAKDDENSLRGYEDTTLKVTPQKNLTMSLNGNFTLVQKVSVNFEYGTSMITDDTRLPLSGEKFATMPVYKKNLSSHQYHAFKTMLSYNSIIGSVGLGVERVDPGYRTLGAYYMNNDFINYTVNYAGRALKDHITMSLSSGLQMDDLNGNKSQETKRFINSVMVGVAPSKTVNVSMMYSNFSNYTHIRTGFENINTSSPYTNIDTLDFTQISQSTGINFSLSHKATEKYRHNINLSFNYQLASQNQTDNPNHANSKFINSMAGYNFGLLKNGLTLTTNFNYSRNIADSITTVIFGPTISARKTLFDKKMNANVCISYNESRSNGVKQSDVYVTRAGIGYALLKKHNFDLNGIYALRNNPVKNEHHNELTITLAYRYNFGLKMGKQSDKQKAKPADKPTEPPAQNQGQSYSPEP